MAKKRIDLLLVERGLIESRNLAQRMVMAGQVRAKGQIVDKPSTKLDEAVELTVDFGPPYVSRGGEKLAGALAAFSFSPAGLICADAGASTGGFTDCLLQNGAEKVYAIDVGHGILHYKLRMDPRVVVMERTNARYVEKLPEPVALAVADASFISLKILLPVIKTWFEENPVDIIALVKPQFEAGKKDVAKGSGVIRDPKIHRRVLDEVISFAGEIGLHPKGLVRSPIKGPKGNIEFLLWLTDRDPHPQNNRLVESLFIASK